jgi:hypothetical protein
VLVVVVGAADVVLDLVLDCKVVGVGVLLLTLLVVPVKVELIGPNLMLE